MGIDVNVAEELGGGAGSGDAADAEPNPARSATVAPSANACVTARTQRRFCAERGADAGSANVIVVFTNLSRCI
jgi:hypothetical protein